MINKVNCKQCGWCCNTLPIPLTYSDIIRFLREDLTLLQEISYIDNYPKKGIGGFYIAKTTFNPKQACPFLDSQKNCSIHSIKPKTCKDFPFGVKTYPLCALSHSLKPNASRADTIKQTQYIDFKQAAHKKEMILRLVTIARGSC